MTFQEADSATRAVADPNPVIDGRKANCNIASFGRPRPSPPRGLCIKLKTKTVECIFIVDDYLLFDEFCFHLCILILFGTLSRE